MWERHDIYVFDHYIPVVTKDYSSSSKMVSFCICPSPLKASLPSKYCLTLIGLDKL